MHNLLRTKLFIPPMPSEVISRPHLVEQLDRGLAEKLSLVTAPAGYGKTTLVTTWLHRLADTISQQSTPQVIWLSLDEGDNDLRRFFTYFVAALCQLDPSFEATEEAYLREPHAELSVTSIVTDLLNQVVAYGQPVVLILDDYHEIRESSIQEALGFWLDNQPPNFHLLLTSRVEPPLPLPRMRVRKQVTEIDTEALRFSRSETADFLNQHMQLNLSAQDIAQLDSITEGWVASLQLAALSLQNKDDPTAFIQTFRGDNRHIVDYLVHEVLNRQPGYIRDFLLQTSILERLNVQLCNAVSDQVGSQRILETLDQCRLFVIPLDDQRHWYRYHHLFAECLQAELKRTKPDEVATYHGRASLWHCEHGFLREAIQHALAANDSKLAAEMVASNARTLLWEQGETHRPWQWIQQLPKDVVQQSPQLLITKAWLHQELFMEHNSQVDQLLDDAELLLGSTEQLYTKVELAEMATEAALARSNVERLRGNLSAAIHYSEAALTQIQPLDSSMLKTGALHSLALNHHQMGNVTQSLTYSDALLESRAQDEPPDYAHFVSLAYRIDTLRLGGNLEKAATTFRSVAPSFLQQQSIGSAMLAISWAEVLRERNQLEEGAEYLLSAIKTLKPQKSMAVVVQAATITLARIRQSMGQGKEALTLLSDALQEDQANDAYYPSARVPATQARLHLQQGNLAAAKTWAEKSGLSANDGPTYLLEIDYLVLARVLIADGAIQAAQTLLDKLEESVMQGGRVARLIEVQTLRALAYQAAGELKQALDQLGQAIKLAQAQGFVRVFADEGKALTPVLKQIAGRGTAIDYIRQLLHLLSEHTQPMSTAVGPPREQLLDAPSFVRPNTVAAESDSFPVLLNPLTDRELATLRYLASDLSIPEIAEQMVVAPSTIRTYVKRIYGKMDVHNRIEAVNRARSLSLIG